MSGYATPEEHAADVAAFTGALAAYADSHEANCTRAEAEAMESGPRKWLCVRTTYASVELEADSREAAEEAAVEYFGNPAAQADCTAEIEVERIHG